MSDRQADRLVGELVGQLHPHMSRILENREDTHDVVGELLATLTDSTLVTQAHGVGALYVVWAELTDIVDGWPVDYGPECDAIARREFTQAAQEWLGMSPTVAGLTAYIEGRTTRLTSLQDAVRHLWQVADAFLAGGARAQDLPVVALQAIGSGLDSPALRELSRLPPTQAGAAADLFTRVMDEFGHPSQRTGVPAEHARDAARALLERRLAPPNAATEIAAHLRTAADVESRGDFAALAAAFEVLAEAWYDRAPDRAAIVADIKAAARDLLEHG